MSKLDWFLLVVETVNKWVGRVISYAVPLLMLIASYEVVMRYGFNAPTIWAWDINKQLFSLIVFLGAGYTLLKNGHVSVDIFYAKWSGRKKAVMDVITFPVFLIFTGILLFTLGEFVLVSIEEREVMSTAWAPPFYPLKTAVFIGVFLLFLQGVGSFLKNLRTIITCKE